MSQPRLEVPAGAIDGLNTTFTVAFPYAPNTTAVFVNGVLQRKDFTDGWVETSPSTGVVTLNIAPETGDTVQIYYIDGLAPSTEVCEVVNVLFGRIQDRTSLIGRLSTTQTLHGRLQVCDV